MKIKVNAIQCPKCKDIIYSRSRHDFRTCSCGDVSIDGGFDYTKISFISVKPDIILIDVDATKEELFNDWNNRKNKFGCVQPTSRRRGSVKSEK